MHFDEWKLIDEDLYYDWKLVRKVSQVAMIRHPYGSHSTNWLGGLGPEIPESLS